MLQRCFFIAIRKFFFKTDVFVSFFSFIIMFYSLDKFFKVFPVGKLKNYTYYKEVIIL